MQVLSFPDAPEWSQRVRLEGKTYSFRARWNTSSNAWSLDVLTSSNALIVAGLRIVRGAAMLRQFQDVRLPPGDLIAYDIGDRMGEYEDFTQGRALLAYVTAAEIEGVSGD